MRKHPTRLAVAGVIAPASLSLGLMASTASAATAKPAHAPAAASTAGARESATAARVQREVNQVVAAHPGAVQTGPGQVSLGHSAVLTIGPKESGVGNCLPGFFCFYQNANFNNGIFNDGRVLHFDKCGLGFGLFTDYGFNDQTSSWVNNTGFTITVYDTIGNPNSRLWTEGPHTISSQVEPANNDKASAWNC